MVERGNLFLERLLASRSTIAKHFTKFIRDNNVSDLHVSLVVRLQFDFFSQQILTHSRSRVVLETLKTAHAANKRFHVYVTGTPPDNGGEQMYKELVDAGIDATLFPDSAIGYIMESVNMVVVGAEGVCESGGIINRLGTVTMAVNAKDKNKPFYVLAESFKFTRLFPLNNRDIPADYLFSRATLRKGNTKKEVPLVDYTAPSYIESIITDLGILTPQAVSDELIKLYL